MANEKSLSQQLGASPKKLALIGVLAVLLAAVLYAQFGASLLGGEAGAGDLTQTARGPKRGAAANDACGSASMASDPRRGQGSCTNARTRSNASGSPARRASTRVRAAGASS